MTNSIEINCFKNKSFIYMNTNSEKKNYFPINVPGIYLYQSFSRRYIQACNYILL